jgi:hypothetical protein
MKEFFKNLFKPNDWVLVNSNESKYLSIRTYNGVRKGEKDRSAFYNIYYSKSRNKYKLKCEGYPVDYKSDSNYYDSLKLLSEYSKNID